MGCANLPGTLPPWLNPVCRGAVKGAAERSRLFSSKAADLGERHHWGKASWCQPSQDSPVSLELHCERDLGASK